MRGLKIALVYPGKYFEPPDVTYITNGLATYTRGLARALVEAGHRVTVISRSEGDARYAHQWRFEGSDIVAIPAAGHLDFAEMVHRYLAANLHDVAEAHQLQYPLLIEQCFGSTPTVTRYASDVVDELGGKDFRFDWYELRVPGESNRATTRDRFLGGVYQARSSQVVVCAGTSQMRRLEKYGIESRSLPLGLRSVAKSVSTRKNLITVMIGRLDDPRKGGEYAVKIVNALPRLNGVIVKVIASASDYAKKMFYEGVDRDDVELVGDLADEEVIEAYDESVAVVVPSISESFGYVFLEPLARGKPVVCFNQNDPSKKHWPLIECGDPDNEKVFAKMSIQVRSQLTKQNGEKYRDFATSFLWKNLMYRYEMIYNDAIRQFEMDRMNVLGLG